jgi:hypothetical protein
MKDKKSRNPVMGLDFGAATTITGMRQNDDGSVTFFGPKGEVLPVKAGFAGLGYDRTKAAKVTYQIPDSGEAIGSLQAALERYTTILAVDTNTVTHAAAQVSVAAIARLSNLRFEGPRWFATAEEERVVHWSFATTTEKRATGRKPVSVLGQN